MRLVNHLSKIDINSLLGFLNNRTVEILKHLGYLEKITSSKISKIIIKDDCWICADVFVGPGVTLGTASVVGARSVIFKDTIMNGVYMGNPGKLIKTRKYKK